MTRINVVPPSELSRQHLLGELHEVLRPFGLVRKMLESGVNKWNLHKKYKQPVDYTLGTGHVVFFYTRLGYIANRHKALVKECINRGYHVNQIDYNSLTDGIPDWCMQDYEPTANALLVNRIRIQERSFT